MTEDLCVGIVHLQTAEQVQQRVLLGRRTRIGRLAVGIEAALVANADRVGVVTAGMGTGHLFRTTTVGMTVLRDVVVIADGLETSCQVTGLEGFYGKVVCDLRRRAVNDNQVYPSHTPQACTAIVPNTLVITVAMNLRTFATLVQLTLIIYV